MDNIQNLYSTLIKRLRLRENGETLEFMNNLGLKYSKNYGVSIYELRKIADDFRPNHSFALHLRDSEIRELKILADMIDNPEEVSPETAAEILQNAETIELAEQAAFNILSKLPFATDLCRQNILSDNQNVQRAVLLTIGRAAFSKNSDFKNDDFQFFVSEIEKLISNPKFKHGTIAFRVLFQIGSANKTLNNTTIESLNRIKQMETKNSKSLADETISLLEYQTYS